MAYEKKNVIAVVTGAWYVAPFGTEVDSDPTVTLPEEFVDLGYTSPDGTTETNTKERAEIEAHQYGEVVKNPVTKSGSEFEFRVLETTPEVLELYFGARPDAEGVLRVNPARVGDMHTFVHHEIEELGDGTINKVRNVIWEGEVVETQPLEYVRGQALSYGLKIKAHRNADGDTYEKFTSAVRTAT